MRTVEPDRQRSGGGRRGEGGGGGGRNPKLLALLLLLILLAGVLLLIRNLREANEVSDCLMQGRTNCNPAITSPSGN
jgi:hypothetical protein